MNKSITQATQNDKQISKSIKRFFTRFHISSALKAVYGKGNPMITGHLGSSFYTFLTKCLISHGYRLFKCCFKCSEQCFQITLNFQTKKSMNWRMHLWMRKKRTWKIWFFRFLLYHYETLICKHLRLPLHILQWLQCSQQILLFWRCLFLSVSVHCLSNIGYRY